MTPPTAMSARQALMLMNSARRTTAADPQDNEGVTLSAIDIDGLNAARGIIRGFLWSLPFWIILGAVIFL